MRKINPRFQEKLDSGATHLCRCWLLIRKDGTTMGFTDHDVDLEFDGYFFQAGTGMNASAIEASTGLSVDNTQAVGALSAAGLTEGDIQSGLYDSAEIRLWLVDWMEPSLRVLLFRGFIGEIQRTDNAFEVELRGLSEALNRTVGRSFLPECDRILGDVKCGFDLDTEGYSVASEVSKIADNRRIEALGMEGFEEGWFEFGVLTWTSGANKGASFSIKRDSMRKDHRVIEAWHAPAHAIQLGDQFKLIAGCNRRAETCKNKFNNFLNFRGFPQMPGEDWVTSYPAQGQVHDGQSLKN